jgi:acyl-CoA thioesterase FadM
MTTFLFHTILEKTPIPSTYDFRVHLSSANSLMNNLLNYVSSNYNDGSSSRLSSLLQSSAAFYLGIIAGIGMTALYPNILPNLEYYRRFYSMHFYYLYWNPLFSSNQAIKDKSSSEAVTTFSCGFEDNRKDIFQFSSKLDLMVLPNWIDRNKHMNNARYIYELNFARRQFFYELNIISFLESLKCNLILQSQTIRYRKELCLWQKFFIEVKIIDWNDSNYSFYLESKFIDSKTNFIHAIHYAKYRIVSSASSSSSASGEKKTAKKLPTPSELLIQLKLLDPAMVSLEKNATSVSIPELSSSDSLNSVFEVEDIPVITEQKTQLQVKNKFVMFWEMANILSSRDLNPKKAK